MTTQTTGSEVEELRLETVTGPRAGPFTVEVGERVVVGRAADCAICVTDPSVSRDHAVFSSQAGRWFVTDLGSRHGSYLNGIRLQADHPAPLAPGDLLRIGPYTFRTDCGRGTAWTHMTTDDSGAPETIVRRLPSSEGGAIALRRLELLIDGSIEIHQATSEADLARSILDLALDGSGYQRGAFLRHTGSFDQVDVIASRDRSGQSGAEFSFSRSLVREAAAGHIASLVGGGAMAPIGHSIVSLDIHSAICSPIFLDSSVVGFVYLDSRGTEPAGEQDSGGFCQAVSRLAGLALSSLKREDLTRRQEQLESDLKAARQAQEFLLPEPNGTIGHLRYVLDTRPGRVVAGDLFDVFAVDDNRVAVCCGDVTGQGVGAGILMTATLSLLRGAMSRFDDPAAAVSNINRSIAERSPDDRFVSLWLGVFDRANGCLQYVDAGHGHWLIRRAEGEVVLPRPGGAGAGLLVGIQPEFHYQSETVELAEGDRVIVFSDGVVEHVGTCGEFFGTERLVDVVARSSTPEGDVAETMSTLLDFIGGVSLKDDTTIASVEIRG